MTRKWLVLSIAVSVLIALDQLTKYWVSETILYGQKIPVIDGFLYLTYHHNPGAAWGILDGRFAFFVVVTILALAMFIYLAKDIDYRRKKFYSLGVTLLIAGTIGNFIDRILYRYVIDFIDVYIFSYDFPIFNVADMCLTVGVVLLGIDLLIFDAKRGDVRG